MEVFGRDYDQVAFVVFLEDIFASPKNIIPLYRTWLVADNKLGIRGMGCLFIKKWVWVSFLRAKLYILLPALDTCL